MTKESVRFKGLISVLMVGACLSGHASMGAGTGLSGRFARSGPLVLTHIANAGVLVSSGERKVLIDALFDKPNPEYRAPDAEVLEKIMRGESPYDGLDLVLVTHNHPDHFDAALAARYLETAPGPILLAPADAVAEIRKASSDWARIEPRVLALDLKAGEKTKRNLGQIVVTGLRTLHSGDREAPMNLMFLFELDGWRVFHEGDSTGKPDAYRGFGLESAPLDLALVHFWFPLDPDCARYLQEVLKPDHIALTHLPIRLESDAPGKIDQVRGRYQDMFLLLPGLPVKIFKHPDQVQRIFGQNPPGLEPVKFLPEILTAEKHPHGQLTLSPDGKSVFWSAMLQDGPEQTIFASVFDGGALSPPVVAPFAADSGNGGPAFSPDGKRLYFSAILPAAGDPDKRPTAICYVQRSGSGWTKPSIIEATLDATMTKGQVSVARSGNIYFSGRAYKERTPGIYISRYADGKHLPPEKLAGPLSEAGLAMDPWVDPDERFLLLSCAPQQEQPMLTDIGISFHRADGTWSGPERLGGAVNTPAFERFPALSPGGKFLFFIRSLSESFVGDQAHFYWVRAEVIDELIKKSSMSPGGEAL